jgi:ArsR family transcriptional regulator
LVLEKKRLLAVLRALADPNRLAIFELLREGTYCNCEIASQLELPANLVSHHLKVLRQAGLVQAQQHPVDRRWVLYSLDREGLAAARAQLASFLDPMTIGSRVPPSCLGACLAPEPVAVRAKELLAPEEANAGQAEAEP